MIKQLSLLTLVLMVATVIPSCSKQKKVTDVQQEEINTLIELDTIIIEKEESADARIIKF